MSIETSNRLPILADEIMRELVRSRAHEIIALIEGHGKTRH